MEKINISDYSNSIKLKLNYLIDYLGYKLTETSSQGVKFEKEIIHKLSYKNRSTKRLLEIVLIGEDFKTHMFTRLGGIYMKRLNNKEIEPDYKDLDNCFQIYGLEEILLQNQGSEKRIEFNDNSFFDVLKGTHWPDRDNPESFGILHSLMAPAGIETIKEKLKEVHDYGYKITYDESDLPHYEQSFMGARISYENEITNTSVSITFQARDQEFYVGSSSNKISDYGRACLYDYEKLKNEMINVINKSA